VYEWQANRGQPRGIPNHYRKGDSIMNKTTQPAITLTTLDAQALLDAIVRLEHRMDYPRLESGHYRIITQLCVALEAPQFYTEHFARKAATTTKEIQS